MSAVLLPGTSAAGVADAMSKTHTALYPLSEHIVVQVLSVCSSIFLLYRNYYSIIIYTIIFFPMLSCA